MGYKSPLRRELRDEQRRIMGDVSDVFLETFQCLEETLL
jgi:hypothetical protein